MDDCVHSIDTLRWICGGEVVAIDSVTKRIQVPDTNFISALLHFEDGATGVLVNSWSSGRRLFSVEIHAPGICAEANPETEGFVYADGDTAGVRHDTKTVSGGYELHVFAGHLAKSQEFIDCVKRGIQPGSSFSDAVKTMEVAETILAQSHLRGV